MSTELMGRGPKQNPSLISSDRQTQLANIISQSTERLAPVISNTDLAIRADDLAAGQLQARTDLATALMRKSEFSAYDGSAQDNRLNGQQIETAVSTLVSTDLIRSHQGQTVGYSPATDDVSVLAALSGAMVKSALEYLDVKTEMKRALIQLLEHAGDHALDMFVGQVNTLMCSDDLTHRELAKKFLVIAKKKFFTVR